MIRGLLKLVVILVVGILIYNIFLGTDEEKQGAKNIVGEVKDVGVAVTGLLKAEKDKFDKGKYDKAVDKIGDMLSSLKENAREFDEKYLSQIEELERKRRQLKNDLEEMGDGSNGGSNGDTNAIKKDSRQLLREIESLMNEMESNK